MTTIDLLMKLKPGKNIRLFENPFLEKFSHVHPALPIALWGPVVVFCFAIGIYAGILSVRSSVITFALGFCFWTFAEYFLHRYVFHFKPKGPIQERIAFLIHGIHHADPHDERRLLMPPTAAIILALGFYTLYLLVLGPVYTNPFFAGFILGYLAYDYIHFATHYMKPKNKWLLWLKQYHLKHHFMTPNKRYGVSNPLWDLVFRTQK